MDADAATHPPSRVASGQIPHGGNEYALAGILLLH